MQNLIGLYLHIPFCGKKCPYCNFCSIPFSKTSVDEYCEHLCEQIRSLCRKYADKVVDTVYFGGGTPSLIATDRLCTILNIIYSSFKSNTKEITIEVNPTSGKMLDYNILKEYGVNRISMGMQSAIDDEIKILGRKHSKDDIETLVNKIRRSGINNISLDLMCCIPKQTIDSLSKSIEFCASMEVSHVSSYMLKLEEGTPFYEGRHKLELPDEETEREMYLFMCERLESLGYNQYEISNFSKSGYESKHNLKYWNCDDYLGIGVSAHSMMDNKRFYYSDSFDDFFNGKIYNESDGGDKEEYAMLRLRLKEGLNSDLYQERFNEDVPADYHARALALQKHGLVRVDNSSISLTREGFLLSNSVIAKLLWG